MNKIVLEKNISAIFLATLLVLGTISTILPSAVQAQQYYTDRYYTQDYEPDYPSSQDNKYFKSKDSSVNVNKIKCNNINSNNNGVDISLGLPSDDTIAEAQTGDEGLSTTDNGWRDDERYNNGNDFRFVCINNNDNENNVVVVNETTPIPPEPTTAILTVNKITICNPQEFGDFCNFNPQITVTGNNPTPSSFPANDTPISVTLGAGLYDVSEAGFGLGMQPCLSRGFDGGQVIGQNTAVCTNISDSCSEDIRAGQELSCTIENTVTSLSGLQGTTESSITSQGVGDSPKLIALAKQPAEDSSDLTAIEKITKLKQQWLELLP